jgi:diadenylate cyclase
MKIIDLIEEVGLSGFLDIAFMSLLIYTVLVWFKRTRAAFVVIGMSIIGVTYLLARQFNLALTTTVFQGFFAIILIAVIIIFQEEIKHFFEQVASRSSIRSFKARKSFQMPRREIEILASTVTALARERIGALIVIRGWDPIVRHLEGGENLNGELSEALLRSIFDPHSVGHDGAVIINGDRVTQFSCHLPLSKNLQKLRRVGTRHAAALGLAELTDALCLVVSEERGTVSAARNGDIQEINSTEALNSLLERFYDKIIPAQERKPWKDFFKRNYKEKVIAVTVTVILWFIFVRESKLDYRTYTIPVEYRNLPAQLIVAGIDPDKVEVTFSGPRRSFYFVDESDIKLYLKLFDVHSGQLKRAITKSNISVPEGLTLENIQPSEVIVDVEPLNP